MRVIAHGGAGSPPVDRDATREAIGAACAMPAVPTRSRSHDSVPPRGATPAIRIYLLQLL
jgi:hypothetical protein